MSYLTIKAMTIKDLLSYQFLSFLDDRKKVMMALLEREVKTIPFDMTW